MSCVSQILSKAEGQLTGCIIFLKRSRGRNYLWTLSFCQLELQPEAPVGSFENLTTVESNNKVKFYTLLTTLMCNHKAGGGGESVSKNILRLALIVSAFVLQRPDWLKNRTEKQVFKVSTQSISFNQAALAVTDYRTGPWPYSTPGLPVHPCWLHSSWRSLLYH